MNEPVQAALVAPGLKVGKEAQAGLIRPQRQVVVTIPVTAVFRGWVKFLLVVVKDQRTHLDYVLMKSLVQSAFGSF